MFRGIFSKPVFGTPRCDRARFFSSALRAFSRVGASTLTAQAILDRGLPRVPHAFSRLSALRGLLELRLASPVVAQELVADLVEIVGQDPQPDVPLKAGPPFVGTPIQPMVFQGIDLRFDRTVLPS